MIEIRYHGRGGQGAVTSAEILASAVIESGRYAQAMPAFGAERRGAPVLAFNRISDERIYLRSNVYSPDIVIVLDKTLFDAVDIKSGIKEGGIVVANTEDSPDELSKKYALDKYTVATINADKVSREVIGRPIPNITILGSLIKAKNLVDLNLLKDAIIERFGNKIGERNFNSLLRANEETNIA